MAFAAGALSKVSVGSTTASLSSAAATGGTGPYTYQWYRSLVSGFTPGAGSLIAGATALTLNDSGLQPGTPYFYVVQATDTGAGNVTANSAQLEVDTIPAQSQNQFTLSPLLGMLDQRFNYNTVPAEIDASQVGTLLPGAAVKIVDSVGGVPKVVGCAANSDEVIGFINYDIKSQGFVAGDKIEMSQGGNVMYLVSTNAFSRGVQVQLDLTYSGGVANKVGSSGADIVGWAFDKATAAGQLVRIKLSVPSFLKA